MKQIALVFLMFLSTEIFGQNSKAEYIAKYKDIAVSQMEKSGVPASIILGQACLESAYGQSKLTQISKNHFGIKCHRSWTGEKSYFNDDEDNECFRKYKNDEDSFIDHSDFLRYNNRYASLFDLTPTDYKSWAYGLKKAGYATNSKYAESLIKVIEDNQLYLYDKNISITIPSPVTLAKMEYEHFVIQLDRKVFTRNDVRYIIVNEGDTFESIAEEFKITKRQLLKYNDLDKKAKIQIGQELYIKPKKSRSNVNFPIHIVQENETMHQISQKYAIKLSKLYSYNNMKPGIEPEKEQEIFMRNKMKK